MGQSHGRGLMQLADTVLADFDCRNYQDLKISQNSIDSWPA